jgi:pSer/pThr/pTyr-binding forkhead associated (FHA) protein
MPAYLEVWRPDGTELVPLERERVSVGRAESNDVAVSSDGKASRLHAVFERLPGGWCVRDLSSRNGTFVNGRRIDRDQPIYPGDEVCVGDTRLVYRAERTGQAAVVTDAAERPPELTPRERDVLLAMFRPVLSGEVFIEPASTADIARSLSVSEPAVKQHLLKLYDKFGIYETGERRRVRLANEALRRGAVTLAEVRAERRS